MPSRTKIFKAPSFAKESTIYGKIKNGCHENHIFTWRRECDRQLKILYKLPSNMRGSLHVLLLHNNSIINELQCIFIVRNMKQKAISLLKSSVQIIINQTTSLKQTSLEKSYLDSFHLLLHSRSFEELAFANCFGLVTFRWS